MSLTLFKKGPNRCEWYMATIRPELSTASNYYGVSCSFGILGGEHEQDIHWIPYYQPPFDVMVVVCVPFLREGYSRARRPRRYPVEPLTVFECSVLRRARQQVFGEQIPLFWTPPRPVVKQEWMRIPGPRIKPL